MDFVAIDFETANEYRDSACAIGLTRVRSGAVEETTYHLIRPAELRFADMNTYIHGITADMVADCPTLRDLWPELQGFIEDSLLVAHNINRN